MRALQIAAGAFFLSSGAIMMIGKKKYVLWGCRIKSRFLPQCYHGTIKEFADAGPSIYLYWGISSALAGGLMLLSALTSSKCEKEA